MFSNYHDQLKMSKGHMPTYNLQLAQPSGSSLKKHQILKKHVSDPHAQLDGNAYATENGIRMYTYNFCIISIISKICEINAYSIHITLFINAAYLCNINMHKSQFDELLHLQSAQKTHRVSTLGRTGHLGTIYEPWLSGWTSQKPPSSEGTCGGTAEPRALDDMNSLAAMVVVQEIATGSS